MKRRVLFKTTPFHTLLKKSPKQCRFKRHCSLSSSPEHAENRGRRRFYSPVFTDISPLPLSPKTQKDADPSTPLAWILTGGLPWMKKQRGQAIVGARPPCPVPWPDRGRAFSPPFSAYKYRGREEAQERLLRWKKKRELKTKRKEEMGRRQ